MNVKKVGKSCPKNLLGICVPNNSPGHVKIILTAVRAPLALSVVRMEFAPNELWCNVPDLIPVIVLVIQCGHTWGVIHDKRPVLVIHSYSLTIICLSSFDKSLLPLFRWVWWVLFGLSNPSSLCTLTTGSTRAYIPHKDTAKLGYRHRQVILWHWADDTLHNFWCEVKPRHGFMLNTRVRLSIGWWNPWPFMDTRGALDLALCWHV